MAIGGTGEGTSVGRRIQRRRYELTNIQKTEKRHTGDAIR
jgi:hypothetical protein